MIHNSYNNNSNPTASSSSSSSDDAVRATNDDAALCRMSAVSLGYVTDPFISHFIKRGTPFRKPPIINRGTYARSTAIDVLVAAFLQLDDGAVDGASQKQIVGLGSGSDTRYFLLKSSNAGFKKYFEIDFPEITSRKCQTIKKNKTLSAVVGESRVAAGGCELYGQDYALIAGDLRRWNDEVVPKLVAAGFDTTAPTLFISECVLVYLPPPAITAILEWCGTQVASSYFVTYEQIRPDDAFGQVMIENLRQRDLHLPGLAAFPTVESQRERYTAAGFAGAAAVTIKEYFKSRLADAELARVRRLEIFDEIEEWELMGDHYCVSWAWKGGPTDAQRRFTL
ncbi:leucine carboxyl methyltransferase 1 [Zopfochytrium polystomum]|nr:leucine carboxyl methyltransferase 1 [Zopfochytrium polystomum]